MSSRAYDITVIGGGIVGLATARTLCLQHRGRVAVLEAETRLATHQTGHNSGVIHSGLYYRPGSLKAVNCATGRDALYRYCERHEVPHERCGKVVLATGREQVARLDELERRGRANELRGLRRLTPAELREIEPHASAVDALLVPQTGIVDFNLVAQAMAGELQERGGEIRTGTRLLAVRRAGDGLVLRTTTGDVKARYLVNCAGLQSDRVARLCGLRPALRIVPFRGAYFRLLPQRGHLVRNLIYPVPDPRFPFLGVHFTRMIRGGVEVGPNAVLALKREGYRRMSFSVRDASSTLAYVGFWRLAARYWRTGAGELYRSLRRSALVRDLRKMIPQLTTRDLVPHGAGVRAQAVGPEGMLLDDFHILEAERMLHVLNAPSPAATASLSIGETLARRVAERSGIAPRPS